MSNSTELTFDYGNTHTRNELCSTAFHTVMNRYELGQQMKMGSKSKFALLTPTKMVALLGGL